MKITKFLHPILGILFGATLFLVGIGVLSAAFVATYKLVQYAKPFIAQVCERVLYHIFQWLPL